jgi:16S rRNA (cytidine1402-2'-O)-methyltransferase
MSTPGTLYLIPVTLASPGDAPQALDAVLPAAVVQIAQRLDYFIVENAKSARAFLKQCGTAKPLQELTLREFNVRSAAHEVEGLLAPLLAGSDAGLLSEAGCPAVADPGALLVQAAHQHGITVRPLSGPSSLMLALMASGLNGQCFAFQGYVPSQEPQRSQRLRELEQQSLQLGQSQLLIETPYRNTALLEALLKSLNPETWLTLATDLTLPSEQVLTQRVSAWRKTLAPKSSQTSATTPVSTPARWELGPAFNKRPTVFGFLAQSLGQTAAQPSPKPAAPRRRR